MKKTLSFLLTAVMLLTLLPVGVLNVSAATSGTTGSCRWTLTGTVLIISGNGRMGDYPNDVDCNTAPWGNRITSVLIEDGVTSIGVDAFHDCQDLTSVIIGNSVRTIGTGAFRYCQNLTEITIPDSVILIGYSAFEYCKGLEEIVIPDSVTTLESSAFYDCSNLRTVTIGDGVTTIDKYSFHGCERLCDLILSDSITTIDDCAFNSAPREVWYTGSYADWLQITGHDIFVDDLVDWHYNTCPKTHSYSGECDARCDKCEWIRNGEDLTSHVYDNACDATCNICDTVRSITHDYADATCTKAKTCKVCGATNGEKLGHLYSSECDTSCNRCKATRKVTHSYKTVIKKATATANGYTVKRCSVCKKETDKTTIYKASKISLSKTAYTYNGKVQKPSVTVKNSKGKTISSKYYTVTYASGRKNVGTYKVTVKFKGNYSGTKTLTFKINPPKTTVKSLTAGSKKLTASITKKSSQVTGYQIQYSTSKSFKTYKSKTVSSYKTTKATLTGLKAKKTYYVRVRTYKAVGGKKYYSGWSTIKYKKTK